MDIPIEFWTRLDQLVATSELVIDRPRGTAHPRYPDFIYPLDYGYLDGTTAADGGGIDVWVGSLSPKMPTGLIVTLDLLKRDSEIKILLGCTGEEMIVALQTHSSQHMQGALIRR